MDRLTHTRVFFLPHKHNLLRIMLRVYYAVSDTTPPPPSVGCGVTRTHPGETPGWCSTGVSVVDSGRETPGPISNPEAKPTCADGTALGRVWESKTPPTNNKHNYITTGGPVDHKEPLSSTGPPAFSLRFLTLVYTSNRAANTGRNSLPSRRNMPSTRSPPRSAFHSAT